LRFEWVEAAGLPRPSIEPRRRAVKLKMWSIAAAQWIKEGEGVVKWTRLLCRSF
jgi:hypothetical protein